MANSEEDFSIDTRNDLHIKKEHLVVKEESNDVNEENETQIDELEGSNSEFETVFVDQMIKEENGADEDKMAYQSEEGEEKNEDDMVNRSDDVEENTEENEENQCEEVTEQDEDCMMYEGNDVNENIEDNVENQCDNAEENNEDNMAAQGDDAEENNENNVLYQCENCYETFNDLTLWSDHCTMHTGIKNYKCEFCEKTFRFQSNWIQHRRIHVYECDLCLDKFGEFPSYRNHLYKVHQIFKFYRCKICAKLFLSKSLWLKDQDHHFYQKTFKCDECGKDFRLKIALDNHTKFHFNEQSNNTSSKSDKRPFKCIICLKSFQTITNYNKHQLIHSDLKLFRCAFCEKSFPTQSNCLRHQRHHAIGRPFVCQNCGKGFMTNEDLIDHERLHTDDKPFKCKHCHQTFHLKDDYTAHQKKHAGEFYCDVCDRNFSQKSSWYRHRRSMLHKDNLILKAGAKSPPKNEYKPEETIEIYPLMEAEVIEISDEDDNDPLEPEYVLGT